MAEEQKALRVHCAECQRRTNHAVIAEHPVHKYHEEYDVHYGRDYRIIRCLGCETVSFQEEVWSSDDVDPETGELSKSETLYPSRTAGRAAVVRVDCLPKRVSLIYDETFKAFNANASVLTAIGLRGIVEAISIEQNCVGGNLDTKIDALVAGGALAKKQAALLHLHRFMGNDAAHEISEPPLEELVSALDIIESLLKRSMNCLRWRVR